MQLNTQAIISILVVVVLILSIAAVVQKYNAKKEVSKVQEPYSLEAAYAQICGTAGVEECKPLQLAAKQALDRADPQYVKYQNQYKQCLADQQSKCYCKNKAAITQSCFNQMKKSKEFQDRVLGCYDVFDIRERQACFEDPYKFLCRDPDSYFCKDISALCAMTDPNGDEIKCDA